MAIEGFSILGVGEGCGQARLRVSVRTSKPHARVGAPRTRRILFVTYMRKKGLQ